jgi:hypothetical protein
MRVDVSKALASIVDGVDFMRYNFPGMTLLDEHDSGVAHFLPGAAGFAAGWKETVQAKRQAKKIPAIVADGREKGIWGNTEGGKLSVTVAGPAPHALAP